jgi:hypothetical protein
MNRPDKLLRDDLRSIVSKLKILKTKEYKKMSKSELISVIRFKELFPFKEEFFGEFEKKKLTKHSVKKIQNKQCSICLENIPKYDKKITLECKHYFHSKCILKWLIDNNTCPTCRVLIKIKKLVGGWIIEKGENEQIYCW